MPWQSLGEFQLTKHWRFTDPVEAEIFRIFHRPVPNKPERTLRGVVAQGFIDEDSHLNRFSSKLFTHGEDLEVFTFYFPAGLNEHSIIIKRLDDSQIDWFVRIEYYYSDNPTEDYQNYLLTRFGSNAITQFSQTLVNNTISNMSLYPLLFSGSTKPKSQSEKLVESTPKKILSANDSRTQVRLYSTNQPILLATGFDEMGEPLEEILRMPPNYYHEDVITSAGMYKGDVYAVSESETNIHVIEFSAK